MAMPEIFSRIGAAAGKLFGMAPNGQSGETVRDSEQGMRPTPEKSIEYLYRGMWVDPEFTQTVRDIRQMDQMDGRVKKLHGRIARDTIRGGLVFSQPQGSSRSLKRDWDDFAMRLQLGRVEKLKSDARGMVMEGNLPLQWVLNNDLVITAGIRMPSETILPQVNELGVFKDVNAAFHQIDPMKGQKIAEFPLWQLLLSRFDPLSFDDMGCMGRPFMDASRTVWRKLRMTEEDLVIRRRHRAPFRVAHTLEGASQKELEDYRKSVEQDSADITTDYYLNKKGGVQAVQGDGNMGEIQDVVHLLDTFFSGSPAPKGLMGYTEGLARDILEDLKVDYYDEVDSIQDTLAFAYESGFRLQMLLKGVVLAPDEISVSFATRRTETPNQLADRMLKWRALDVPQPTIDREMGFNPEDMQKARDEARNRFDPYPGGTGSIGKVSITPGNAPKGESMTSIGNGSPSSLP